MEEESRLTRADTVDDDDLDGELLRGTVLSGTGEFYEVFLTDVGQIR